MINRRKFIETSAFGTAGILVGKAGTEFCEQAGIKGNPIVISTWAPNVKANYAAWEILGKGGRALDAVVRGVQIP